MEKPVVASDIPGINESAARDSEALLVPPADPAALADGLQKLLHDMPAALAMGRRAGKKARQYGLQEYLDRHSDFYHSVPAKGGG